MYIYTCYYISRPLHDPLLKYHRRSDAPAHLLSISKRGFSYVCFSSTETNRLKIKNRTIFVSINGRKSLRPVIGSSRYRFPLSEYFLNNPII